MFQGNSFLCCSTFLKVKGVFFYSREKFGSLIKYLTHPVEKQNFLKMDWAISCFSSPQASLFKGRMEAFLQNQILLFLLKSFQVKE